MKQTLILLAAIVALTSLATAQSKYFGGVNADVYLPSGTFGDIAGTGFGGSVTFGKPINENISAYVNAGYIMWGKKTVGVPGYSYSYSYHMIPIKVGGKYFFGKGGFKPYGMLEVGYSSLGVKTEWESTYYGTTYSYSGTASETRFGFAPGAGFEYPIGEKMALDVNVRYELISDFNNIAFRAGLKMGF